MAHILVVEDDFAIRELIKRNLQMVGHTCCCIAEGDKVIETIEKEHFDLVILDVMLPVLSGFEVIQELENIPVIFVTARGALEDKLKGLSLGAEDYIVKPFEVLELIARVGVVLKRCGKNEALIKISDVEIDMRQHVVTKAGAMINLTPQEFRLLEVLIQNKNLALSREQLLNLAWDYDYEGESKTVDVHIRKLRQKLGLEEYIKTISKIGYRLELR
ncbi:MAG: response regulator transcription factor [Agathobacter sp.]|nr:response regulator transcription factor [Agathobacter sp.]